MKILEDYKKVAQELLFEVDDEKMIKYKDEDGESKEMKAGSAKTMPDEYPAKQAYNKMKDDDGDDKEEPSGQKLGGKSDFSRDGDDDKPKADEPKGDDVDSGKRKADRETADMLSDTDLVDDEGKILGMDTIDFVKQVGDSIKAQNPDMSDEDYERYDKRTEQESLDELKEYFDMPSKKIH